MKQLFTLIVFFSLGAALQAQSVLKVPFGPAGTLNDAIEGDTTADGSRVDVNRIYELERGVPYLLTSGFNWSGYNLHIRAEPGDGARPIILQSVGEGGGAFSQMFRTNGEGNITLEGLHISGLTTLGGNNTRGVRVNSEKAVITIDDCIVEQFSQSGFRCQADSMILKVSNSIINRIGPTNDRGNGRFVDNRGVYIDSLIVENTVIYNMSGYFYRSGGGTLGTAYFKNNTMWFSGGNSLLLDDVGTLNFTNNIVTSGYAYGVDEADLAEEPEAWMYIDTFLPESNNWVISNNNFFADPDVAAAQPETNDAGEALNYLTDNFYSQAILDALGETEEFATNISEEIDFFDKPIVTAETIDAMARDTSGDVTTPDWDFSDLTPDPLYSQIVDDPQIDRYTVYHDFCYDGTMFDSGTGGVDGGAIGASVNCDITSSTADLFVQHNLSFYPNPTTDRVYINNLDNEIIKEIYVTDMLGRQLVSQRVMNEFFTLDLTNLPSGPYFVTVRNDDDTMSTQKVIKN